MSEEVFEEYPRLLMLEESGGKIEGRLKFHKMLYKYRNAEDINWDFRREEHGPFDEGLSSVFDTFEKTGLAKIEEEHKHTFILTRDGHKFIDGLKQVWTRLEDEVRDRVETAQKVVEENEGRSGSEIEQDSEIQEVKDETVIQEII